jgi:hypothetical protein
MHAIPRPDRRVQETLMTANEWRLSRDDLIPGGHGVLVPVGELPGARAGDVVTYSDRATGRERRGRIVGLIEQDGAQIFAVAIPVDEPDTRSEREESP